MPLQDADPTPSFGGFGVRLLITAAQEVVQDISKPYDNYDAELVAAFRRVLQIIREESTETNQRRAAETLIRSLSSNMEAEIEES